MKKKAELKYIIFISVFTVIMSIIGGIFLKNVYVKTENPSGNSQVFNVLQFLSEAISNIPVVGRFISITVNNVSFAFIDDRLNLLYLALLGPPLGYIIVRLIRGGG